MILIIDNYDSFTYNIYQIFRSLGEAVTVIRDDRISIPRIRELNPGHLVISPGPGRPEKRERVLEIILHFSGRIPILGICLGHQAIGVAFGARVITAGRIMHGKESVVTHEGQGIFRDLSNPLTVIRYHSLELEKKSIPGELTVSALSEEGSIMAIRHERYSTVGVQFHPESIGTLQGRRLLENFIREEKQKPVLHRAIRRLVRGEDLGRKRAAECMEEIAAGRATQAQIASVLTALSAKGERVEEIAGFAEVLRRKSRAVRKPPGVPVIDTCGTGGDLSGTFNISTTAALVAAAAGCTVAKHGNRSVTSRCGSADLLETLGVSITMPPERVEYSLKTAGIGFLFAPGFHPGMKYAAAVRREMGVRTIFNVLGPLANPAGADSQLIGVFDEALCEVLARVLVRLGVKRAMVVHGRDGLDEITLTGETRVCEVKDGWIQSYCIHPRDFGLSPCEPGELGGGQLRENAEITLEILQGCGGPRRDVVVLNAGAAIYLNGRAENIREGIRRAAKALDEGAAARKLDELVRVSNEK